MPPLRRAVLPRCAAEVQTGFSKTTARSAWCKTARGGGGAARHHPAAQLTGLGVGVEAGGSCRGYRPQVPCDPGLTPARRLVRVDPEQILPTIRGQGRASSPGGKTVRRGARNRSSSSLFLKPPEAARQTSARVGDLERARHRGWLHGDELQENIGSGQPPEPRPGAAPSIRMCWLDAPRSAHGDLGDAVWNFRRNDIDGQSDRLVFELSVRESNSRTRSAGRRTRWRAFRAPGEKAEV